MFLYLKRQFSPPVFPNDETKTRRASIVNVGLILAISQALIISAGNVLGGKTPATVTTTVVVALGVCVILYLGLRRGRVELAGFGLLTCGVVSIAAIIAEVGTIRTPITAYYLGLVIGAGLLFDLSGILVATALSSLIVFGLILAENA